MTDTVCEVPVFPAADYVVPDYSPSWQALRNHEIMQSFRENDWDVKESTYNEGVLLVGLLFAAMGVVLILCTPVFNLILDHCVCCCRKERQLTPHDSHVKYMYLATLLLVFMGVATSTGGFVKIDRTLEDLEDDTYEISDSINEALEITTAAVTDTSTGAQVSLDLAAGLAGCAADFGNATDLAPDLDLAPEVVLANLTAYATTLGEHMQELSDNMAQILDSALGSLADDVEGIADSVGETTHIRRAFFWILFCLQIVCIAVFVYLGVMHFFYDEPPPAPPMKRYGSVRQLQTERTQRWEGAAGAGPRTQDKDSPPKRTHRMAKCMSCCTWPAAIALIFSSWLIVAATMSLAAFSADFCIEPDENVLNVIDSPAVLFYVVGCRSLDLAGFEGDAIAQVQAARESLPDASFAACSVVEEIGGVCPTVEATSNELAQQVQVIVEDVNNLYGLISCENINGIYTSVVYGEVCTDLSKALYAVWVGSMLVGVAIIVTMLLWRILMEQRNNLWHKEMEHDARKAKPAVAVTGFSRAPPAGPDDSGDESQPHAAVL